GDIDGGADHHHGNGSSNGKGNGTVRQADDHARATGGSGR
ncbi:MAG: hypothetical protein QOF00_1465, partial [Pseudonocardiales bacterium]|nr:hypothetical protein [Pseudonocardiales bacterium]